MSQTLQHDTRPSPLQRKVTGNHAVEVVPPIVDEVLHSAGQPLDTKERIFFERRFNHDFGQLQVHADEKAAESTRKLNALAYTAWPHIAFARGQYQPTEPKGQKLLAHELCHFVQQAENGTREHGSTGAGQFREQIMVQCADDWTLDELIELGPTFSAPEQATLDRALQTVASNAWSASDFEVLLRKAISDFRAEQIGEGLNTLSNRDLALSCGQGRDVTVISLGTLMRNSPKPIAVYRFQAMHVFDDANQHAFAVVVLPDGAKYLIDPTFSQFMSVPNQKLNVDSSANILRDDPEGTRMARQLVDQGYILLTEETAALYARGNKVPACDEARMARRLLACEGAELFEAIGGGHGARLSLGRNHELDVMDEASLLEQLIARVEKNGDPQDVAQNLREYLLRIHNQIRAEKPSASLRPSQSPYQFQRDATPPEAFDPHAGERSIELNSETGEISRRPVYVPVDPFPEESMRLARGPGVVGRKVVAGALAAVDVLSVANSILAPFASIHSHQRETITRAEDRIAFWRGLLGREPEVGYWDWQNNQPATQKGSATGVGVLSNFVYAYIKDLDLKGLHKFLLSRCRNYPAYRALIQEAAEVQAIVWDAESERAVVVVNAESSAKVYDVTNTLAYVEDVLLKEHQTVLSAISQRGSEETFRLRGPDLFVFPYEDARATVASKTVGPKPLVVVDAVREDKLKAIWHLDFSTYAKVRAANLDFYRALSYVTFTIPEGLDEWHRKLKNRGIRVEPKFLDPLAGERFRILPDAGEGQFGAVEFRRDPALSAYRTIGYGELRYVWVRREQLEPLVDAN